MNNFNTQAFYQVTANSISPTMHIYNLTDMSAIVQSSGSFNGNVAIQVSNEWDPAGDTMGQFIPQTFATVNATTTALGAITIIPSTKMAHQFARVNFTAASGTGFLNVWLKGNGY